MPGVVKGEPGGKLAGGKGVLEDVVVGEDVPGTTCSEIHPSAWEVAWPTPRSMKRERNFLSRA